MKRSFSFWLIGMIPLIMAAAAVGVDKTKSEEAFERLASLRGEWKGEQEGVKISLIYTLTANGSALTEEFRPRAAP